MCKDNFRRGLILEMHDMLKRDGEFISYHMSHCMSLFYKNNNNCSFTGLICVKRISFLEVVKLQFVTYPAVSCDIMTLIVH